MEEQKAKAAKCDLQRTKTRAARGEVSPLTDPAPQQLRGGATITLKDVALDSRLAANLISVPRLTAAGYEVSFGDACAVVRKAGGNGAALCVALSPAPR